MGYSNSFKLKIVGGCSEDLEVFFCPKCERNSSFGKFCSNDGTELIRKTVKYDVTESVIQYFREESEDAAYLLNNDGGSEKSGNGYHIEPELIKFSTKYPATVFQLDGEYELGLECPPSRVFIKNGKKQDCSAKLVYAEYDENKLI